MADALEVGRVELFRFHQHVLAHADLAEVVQEAGVAQLAQLLRGEAHVAEAAAVGAIDRLGQPHREVGHAERVAEGGGVARLDRGDGGLHEAVEELADAVVEAPVGQRHRGLRGQRAGQPHVAVAVGAHVLLGFLGRAQRPAALGLAVDELQGADDLALRRAHRYHQHGLRAVPGVLVEPAVDLER